MSSFKDAIDFTAFTSITSSYLFKIEISSIFFFNSPVLLHAFKEFLFSKFKHKVFVKSHKYDFLFLNICICMNMYEYFEIVKKYI